MSESTLTTNDLFRLLEERRVEEESRIIKVYDRLDGMKKDLRAEIEKSHNEIMDEIKLMRVEMHRHTQEECKMLDELNDRVGEIEKWRWLVVGGAAAVAFIVFGGLESILHFISASLK